MLDINEGNGAGSPDVDNWVQMASGSCFLSSILLERWYGVMVSDMGHEVRASSVPVLPLTSYINASKFFNLYKPPFPHLKKNR